jgi:hypothetical protein
MNWILEHYNDILAAIGAVVTAASSIVLLTPSTRDDEFLGRIIAFIEKFSVFSKNVVVPPPKKTK